MDTFKSVFSSVEYQKFSCIHSKISHYRDWEPESALRDCQANTPHLISYLKNMFSTEPHHSSIQDLFVLHSLNPVQRASNVCYPEITRYPAIVDTYEFESKKVIDHNLEKYPRSDIVQVDWDLEPNSFWVDFNWDDIDKQDAFGNTALMIACYGPSTLPIIKKLVKIGANLNVRNSMYQNCYKIAILFGQLDVLEYLIYSDPSCIRNLNSSIFDSFMEEFLSRESHYNSAIISHALDRNFSSEIITPMLRNCLKKDHPANVMHLLETHQGILEYKRDYSRCSDEKYLEIVSILVEFNISVGFGYKNKSWLQCLLYADEIENFDLVLMNMNVCDQIYFFKRHNALIQFTSDVSELPFSVDTYNILRNKFYFDTRLQFNSEIFEMAYHTAPFVTHYLLKMSLEEGRENGVWKSLYHVKQMFPLKNIVETLKKVGPIAYNILFRVICSYHKEGILEDVWWEDWMFVYCFDRFCFNDETDKKLYIQAAGIMLKNFLHFNGKKAPKERCDLTLDYSLELLRGKPQSLVYRFINAVIQLGLKDLRYGSSAELIVLIGAMQENYFSLIPTNASSKSSRFFNICSGLNYDVLTRIVNLVTHERLEGKINPHHVEISCVHLLS